MKIQPLIFPGVDPWLESSGKFQGFHQNICVKIAEHLEANLPWGYSADPEGSIEISRRLPGGEACPSRRNTYRPDVGVYVQDQGPAVAMLPPSMALIGAVRGIYAHDKLVDGVAVCHDEDLVTWIEVLSPWNKTSDGAMAFRAKRANFLSAGVNFVTVDLVRKGGCTFEEPIGDYTIGSHHHSHERPFAKAFGVRDPIPDAYIPLLAQSEGYDLPLGGIYQATWMALNIGRKMAYLDDHPSPELSSVDLEWARALVRLHLS